MVNCTLCVFYHNKKKKGKKKTWGNKKPNSAVTGTQLKLWSFECVTVPGVLLNAVPGHLALREQGFA